MISAVKLITQYTHTHAHTYTYTREMIDDESGQFVCSVHRDLALFLLANLAARVAKSSASPASCSVFSSSSVSACFLCSKA